MGLMNGVGRWIGGTSRGWWIRRGQARLGITRRWVWNEWPTLANGTVCCGETFPMFVNFSSSRFQKTPRVPPSVIVMVGHVRNVGHDTERVQCVWTALSHHVARAFLVARASSQHEPLLQTAWA